MTRKHYIALADALRRTRPDPDSEASYAQWELDVANLADVLNNTSMLFHKQRWLDYVNGLCGPCGGK